MMTTPLRAFRTPIRGHAFAARPPEAVGPRPGQLARLVREPGNPADRYAVSVWVADVRGRWRIGYLDRGVAARVAPRLDGGTHLAAQIEGWAAEPEGRWLRPLVLLLPPDEPDASPSKPQAAPSSSRQQEPRPSSASGVSSRAVAPASSGASALWQRPPGVTRRTVRSR